MSLIAISIFLHVLAAVIWVGGMFFAYMALRPVAAQQLEPPQRLRLWLGVFARFFPYVWLSVAILPLTGYNLMFNLWGSFAEAPLYVHLMNGLGTLMILIYMHVYFAPFRRLGMAVAIEDWADGGKRLNQIRMLIRLNLSLGLVVVAIATYGRFLA